MTTFLYLFQHIKSIFFFKKSSYVILSALVTSFSSFFLEKVFVVLKVKLDSDDFIMTMLIAIFMFFIIFIVIAFDTFTGLIAAKYEKQVITSAKGLMSIFKMIFYSIWIFIILIFQIIAYISNKHWILSILNYTMFFSASLITLWEFKSIGENLERRFHKRYAFFGMIDKIIDVLESKVGSFLENSVCKKIK